MPDYIPYYKGEPISLPPLKLFTDFFYPVGCYFETTDTDFDPNTTWGGTWVLEDEGLVHVSSGTNYVVSANSQDGGAKQITYTPQGTNAGIKLSAAQSGMPSHNHSPSDTAYGFLTAQSGTVGRTNHTNGGSSWVSVYANGSVNRHTTTNSKSASATEAHSHTFTGTQATLDNMQPYKIVNRWHRTA